MNKLVLLATLGLLPGFAVADDSPSLQALRDQQQELAADVDRLDLEMRGVRRELADKAAEVRTWKERATGISSPIGEYRLQALLKEAQLLADKLNAMGARRHEVITHRLRLARQAAPLLDGEIDAWIARLAKKAISREQRRDYTIKLKALLDERQALDALLSPAYAPTMPAQLPAGHEASLEELQARVALLTDQRNRIEKDLRELRERTAQLRRQKLVMEEARHLLDEEVFFAESSFAKTAATSDPSASLDKELGAKLHDGGHQGGSDEEGTPSESAGLITPPNNGNTPPPDPGGVGNQPPNSGSGGPATAGGEPMVANIDAPTAEMVASGDVTVAQMEPVRRLELEGVAGHRGEQASLTGQLATLRQYEVFLKHELTRVQNDLETAVTLLKASELGQANPGKAAVNH